MSIYHNICPILNYVHDKNFICKSHLYSALTSVVIVTYRASLHASYQLVPARFYTASFVIDIHTITLTIHDCFEVIEFVEQVSRALEQFLVLWVLPKISCTVIMLQVGPYGSDSCSFSWSSYAEALVHFCVYPLPAITNRWSLTAESLFKVHLPEEILKRVYLFDMWISWLLTRIFYICTQNIFNQREKLN